jgi:hypothetical protein
MYTYARRDPTVGLLLEILLGWVGFLGIGNIYAGNVGTGIFLLIAWWIVVGGNGLAHILTGGWICCFGVPFHLLVPVVSGLFLYGRMRAR